MDYHRIYTNLIEKAKSENRSKQDGKYYEGHHIIPKCLGGQGSYGDVKHPNIALLTAKEHFIAHKLLLELHPEVIDLQRAFILMCRQKDRFQRNYRVSSREFERCRSLHNTIQQQESGIRINQYNLEGQFIQSFTSAGEAERVLGISSRSISNNLVRRSNSAGGFIFTRALDKVNTSLLADKYKLDQATSLKLKSKQILQYDQQGILVGTFSSISEACRSYGLSISNVCKCLKGTSKSTGGFIWKYA